MFSSGDVCWFAETRCAPHLITAPQGLCLLVLLFISSLFICFSEQREEKAPVRLLRDVCVSVRLFKRTHGSYRNNHEVCRLWFHCSDGQCL